MGEFSRPDHTKRNRFGLLDSAPDESEHGERGWRSLNNPQTNKVHTSTYLSSIATTRMITTISWKPSIHVPE